MAKKKRSSAFVPKLLVPAAAVISVVPAIAVSSCSGDVTSSSAAYGVAAVAYPAYEAGSDAPPDQFLGVAAVAYPAYEAGADAADAQPDNFFGVAAVAYPAYEGGAP